MSEINLENWKKHKGSEAQEIFKLNQIVIYEIGFTRYSGYVGQVQKITPAGIIYVNPIELKFVERNKLERPEDCQLSGWHKYDPKKIIKVEDEILRFMPTFENHYSNYKFHDPKHPLIWRGEEHSGLWNLRVPKLDEKGLIKLTYDSVLD